MKNIYKLFILSLLFVGAVSCSDSSLPIDQLYNNVDTSASFIRTIAPPSSGPHNVSGGTFPNTIEALIEVQEGNGLVQPDFVEVRVYMSPFDDQDQIQPTVDENGNEIGETLLSTIPASVFTPSDVNNLPSTQISIPLQDVVDLLPGAQFTIPTFIYIRLELEMSDGRIFTAGSVGPTVETGNYFIAPFFYNIIFLNL
jgi:hypothetical protein